MLRGGFETLAFGMVRDCCGIDRAEKNAELWKQIGNNR